MRCSVAILLGAAEASTPEPVIRNISIDQGLSDTHLRAIVQDGDGFLWFGTADGLNRYDGYEIRIFDHEPENPRSLGSSFVQALHVDRAGTLWVGTLGGGLSRYEALREDFVRFQHDPEGAPTLTRGTGAKPSATVAQQLMATVTVKAIDPKVPSLTVTTEDGNTMSFKVDDKKNIQNVKVGDRVEITYTAAVMITVK
jgi:hypothetical protein